MSGSADTSGGSATTRDWNKIDTDQDGSVSPQEMDNWLQNKPRAGRLDAAARAAEVGAATTAASRRHRPAGRTGGDEATRR